MKKILLFLILLGTIGASAQKKAYVISYYGTELKARPSWSSKTLDTIKVGDSISVIKPKLAKAERAIQKDSIV